jgi:predicted dehydrogenase
MVNERPLRAVLAGCGGISRTWLTAIRDIPGLTLAGLVDIDEAAAQRRASEFGLTGAVIGTDLAAVLDRVQPDLVFDCTVPPAHVGVALTALAHGCHVLGEKPLADSLDGARRVVVAAREAGRLQAVIQNRRYDPNIRRLARFLRSGTLGRLTTVQSDFFIGAHFGGFRDEMRHVLILDMAIHTFDAARLLTGADPVAVTCREWNPPSSWYHQDASAVALFTLTGDIRYVYHGSWCAEGLNTNWECAWRFIGERGSVRWDGVDGFQAEVIAGRTGLRSTYEPIVMPPLPESEYPAAIGHAGVIRNFVDCVQTGRMPETAGTDNIRSLAMVFGAIESAETGRDVTIAW